MNNEQNQPAQAGHAERRVMQHDNCPRCGKTLTIGFGMPNLYKNKYCPDKRCGWKAWHEQMRWFSTLWA